MNEFRVENDFLGSLDIPAESLYGIHSLRAKQNFPDQTRFNQEWYKAIGIVKLACYETYKKFLDVASKEYGDSINDFHFARIDETKLNALIQAGREVSEGKYFDQFIVPAIQGGAGTAANMNVNEIIANRALQLLHEKLGNYKLIDPTEHANIFQSTNDVIPTALKTAIMRLLNDLEDAVNRSRSEMERLEAVYRQHLRLGYTQMQEAVPVTYGRLFSTYCEALSRDWWRVSKCFERIKVVNLGGSAVGTGLTIPRFFIMEIVQTLKSLTGLPLSRADNLSDATSNLDSFVEVHSILKAHAVNLEKIVSDLRLLSSDLFANKELFIPQRQVGSSIMPGKVNPVIPEFVIGIAHKIYANDVLISSLSAQGLLELNAYIPIIGNALTESLQLLISANKSFSNFLLKDLKIVENESAKEHVYKSISMTTVLIPFIGYKKATEIAFKMKEEQMNIFELNKELHFMDEAFLQDILKTDQILKTGYTLKEVFKHGKGKIK
jgi:aspartate ammonia-lyase